MILLAYVLATLSRSLQHEVHKNEAVASVTVWIGLSMVFVGTFRLL